MMVQTEKTPNPNTLKFLPGQTVSEVGPVEFTNKKIDEVDVKLAKEILSANGVELVFFGQDFITVKKEQSSNWKDLKPQIISYINNFYLSGNKAIITEGNIKDKKTTEASNDTILKIKEILDSKIRPAVARDGGDIKFKSFINGIVTVELRGSCSGCPSSVLTLKQGVQNLLCHYISEVKSVEAI